MYKELDGYEKVRLQKTSDTENTIAEKALAGKQLVEEQNHEDGHFLIFLSEAGRLQKKKSLPERVYDLETKVKELEERIEVNEMSETISTETK